MTLLLAVVLLLQVEGPSLLALCHSTWNCDKSESMLAGSPKVFGWLETTFGLECPCVDKLLKSPGEKVVRVHVVNGPCLNNQRCKRGELFYQHTSAAAKRRIINPKTRLHKRYLQSLVRAQTRLAAATEPFKCYISPILESRFDRRVRKVLLAIARDYFPQCSLVDSPLRGPCVKGVICERHGTRPRVVRPCIADNDGQTFTSAEDIEKFREITKACEVRFIWEPWMNCLDGAWKPPMERVCQ